MNGTRTRPLLTGETSQEGFGLIEVVIAAAILLMVTVGTLSLIDGANDLQARNKARSVAASLADQDQERMRATPVQTLGGTADNGRLGSSTTTTKTVAGVPYTVLSKAEWLADTNGLAPSCSADGAAEYLQLTSTVTNQRTRRAETVTQTSLLAPELGAFGPNTGSLSILLTDRSNNPITSTNVKISNGTKEYNRSTNAAGCAVFNFIPSGTYTASSASVLGNVLGDAPGSVQATVTDNNLTAQELKVGAPARLDVSVTTPGVSSSGSGSAIAGGNSSAFGFMVANPGMNINGADGTRTFIVGTESASLSTASSTFNGVATKPLFPFVDGYEVWAGTCDKNRPGLYPGGVTATINPMQPTVTQTLALTQPMLALQVKRGFNKNNNQAEPTIGRILATPADEGCDDALRYPYPSASIAVEAYQGRGLPWGTYSLCVPFTFAGTAYKQVFAASNIVGTGSRQTLTLGNGATTGSCS